MSFPLGALRAKLARRFVDGKLGSERVGSMLTPCRRGTNGISNSQFNFLGAVVTGELRWQGRWQGAPQCNARF
ncbi:hypothetical protein D6817_01910 [Candidatus Pacearchaeota archaeon]|nr:MAG: hypothetical protein D6817_01910 [Candidatus Pacearchaeota archaeon]